MTNPAALNALADGDLANFLVASTPGGIEAQEAAGQRALVSQFTQLPKDMGPDGLKIAEAMGFTIGEDADDLFVNVVAPEGWRMDATGHSMHSEIFDAAGNKRGSVFYKAAFYDRRADGNWSTRYAAEKIYPIAGNYDTSRIVALDRETGEEMYGSEDRTRPEGPYGEAHRELHAYETAAFEVCRKFIEDIFPGWESPAAYWGEND